MDLNSKVVFSDAVFAQEVDGEMVLLDMGTENYFGLDRVAGDIWKFLREGRTVGETYDALLEIYDVDPQRLDQVQRTAVAPPGGEDHVNSGPPGWVSEAKDTRLRLWQFLQTSL